MNVRMNIRSALMGAALAAALAGCGSSAIPAVTPSAPATSKVTFEVYGTARSADITMNRGAGGIEQHANVALPMMNQIGGQGLTFQAAAGSTLYLSAQNDGSGTITCRVTVDEVVVQEVTSSGPYAIATCTGRL